MLKKHPCSATKHKIQLTIIFRTVQLCDSVRQPFQSHIHTVRTMLQFHCLVEDFTEDVLSVATERRQLSDKVGKCAVSGAFQFAITQTRRQSMPTDVHR